MQRIERIQPEAVGFVEQVEQLAVQLRHFARMLGLPLGFEHDEVGASEANSAVAHWLEEKNLRRVGVDISVMEDAAVHEMESHCAEIAAADASEQQRVRVAHVAGIRHVLEWC